MNSKHSHSGIRSATPSKRIGILAVAALVAATAFVGLGAPAQAASTGASSHAPKAESTRQMTKSVDVRQIRDGASVTVHIEFDKPVTRKKAAKLAGAGTSGADDSGRSQRLKATPRAGSTTVLHCGNPAVLSTGKGTLRLRHGCGSTSVKWGYRINTGLQKVIVSKVHEAGMKYTHAGKTKTGKAHTAPKDKYFTGKFSPARSGSIGKYRDSLKFVTDYGLGGISRTTITVRGTFSIAG